MLSFLVTYPLHRYNVKIETECISLYKHKKVIKLIPPQPEAILRCGLGEVVVNDVEEILVAYHADVLLPGGVSHFCHRALFGTICSVHEKHIFSFVILEDTEDRSKLIRS